MFAIVVNDRVHDVPNTMWKASCSRRCQTALSLFQHSTCTLLLCIFLPRSRFASSFPRRPFSKFTHMMIIRVSCRPKSSVDAFPAVSHACVHMTACKHKKKTTQRSVSSNACMFNFFQPQPCATGRCMHSCTLNISDLTWCEPRSTTVTSVQAKDRRKSTNFACRTDRTSTLAAMASGRVESSVTLSLRFSRLGRSRSSSS